MEQRPWQEKLFLSKAVKRKSKVFHEKGYRTVSENDIWQYLVNYRWKNQGKGSLSEKKLEIETFTFNDYFDYQRLKAQTKPPQEFDWEDLTDIL